MDLKNQITDLSAYPRRHTGEGDHFGRRPFDSTSRIARIPNADSTAALTFLIFGGGAGALARQLPFGVQLGALRAFTEALNRIGNRARPKRGRQRGAFGFMRVAPKPDEIAEIYIDESSQNNHRYLAIGCVINMLPEASRLSAAIAKTRLPELPSGEAKWSKVSKQKLSAYKRIADVLFDNLENVNFHSLVVDNTLVNHRRFNAGSREIGFNKEIYQLAMKCARLYSNELFHLYPDQRVTSQKPDDLRLILNRGCTKAGDKRVWPFRRCQFRDSKNTALLQLVDLITGAIAFRLNGHDKEKNASAAKCELSAYILERAGIADPFRDTAIAAEFTVWHRRLR